MSCVIVVIEGPSAAGKTTWATTHALNNVIAETGPASPPSDGSDDDLARFWSDLNCRRWMRALEVESEFALALCDTDPLKLHYDYCLARLGRVTWDRFEAGISATTEAIKQNRLGLADIVLVSIPDDRTLALQRDSDSTRGRSNFDLHRLLSPALRDWYATLDQLDSGRVLWGFPEQMPSTVVRERYDADLFRSWMGMLPRHVAAE